MAGGQHGGYRRPEHPAPVSGPGALSQRTDGGPATQPQMIADGGPYGSRQEMAGIQGGAPMQGGGGAPPPPPPVPLGAETQNPDEPVTAGADGGPGMGQGGAGIGTDESQSLAQLAPLMESLEVVANLPFATPDTQDFVRQLKARLAAQ